MLLFWICKFLPFTGSNIHSVEWPWCCPWGVAGLVSSLAFPHWITYFSIYLYFPIYNKYRYHSFKLYNSLWFLENLTETSMISTSREKVFNPWLLLSTTESSFILKHNFKHLWKLKWRAQTLTERKSQEKLPETFFGCLIYSVLELMKLSTKKCQ